MSYSDPIVGAVSHCEAMAAQFPDLAEPFYNKIAQYCEQKLWHQLTTTVLEFVGAPAKTLRPLNDSTLRNTFLAVYQSVLLVSASKLNALSLARIAAATATASVAANSLSVDESKKLLEDLLEKQEPGKPLSMATTLFLKSTIGLVQLEHSNDQSKAGLSTIYETIKANAVLLNQLMPDTPEAMIVNAVHYEMSMTYYKLVGPPEAYYNEAIHYLNYFQPNDPIKAKTLAIDLCLAALTGEGVYNLGQVVTNPIVQVLQGTPEAWLVELLQACANGHVQAFQTLFTQTYPAQIASQPALVHRGQQLQEKSTLLALVQMVFERPASDRTLKFDDIAQRLMIPLDQVEWVLMRACSVQLIQGTLDQVDGTVHITWVLPRTLDSQQLSELAGRFGEWASKVNTTKEYMQDHATLSV
jgi:26S proteasome regulatory subunit N9